MIEELPPRRRPHSFRRNIAAAALAIGGFMAAILYSLFRRS